MRKFARILVVVVFTTFCVQLSAQRGGREQVGDIVRYNDTTWYDRGFDAYIAGGMFWGSKKNALYYNGSRQNECNIDYLLTNQYWYRDILAKINELYPHISVNDQIFYNESDLNWSPHYNLNAALGLGIRYKIRNNWGISLSYMFSKMTITNKFLLSYTSVSGNEKAAPEITLYGHENRSMIDLSMSYLFSQTHRIVKPFVEVGAQFNYVKVKNFDAILLDKNNNEAYKHTLLDIYGGEHYVPGAQMNTYDVIYGGPGWGLSFSAGIKFVVNKNISIDPTFYGCFSQYNLKVLGDKVLSFNYGAMVRIVMNDFFFQNR